MNFALALGIAGLVALASSAAVYAAAAVTLVRLRRTQRGEPLAGFAPPVSIIKPLAGLDEELEENLETFFRLDYETYEIIFSFARKDDPAYRVARRVADRYPGVRATFVFDEREPGGNAKVNRLSAASRYVRHHHVLFSDGNVRVRPDFLRRAVSWFLDPRVGLVSHLFRGVGASSLGSRVESLYLNGCLMPGTAFIAAVLRRPCVVGKSILVSRQALDAIGGIGALRDYLAEDYVLGRQVRRAGFRVVLSTDVLDTVEVSKPLRTVWLRHRRWGMMRKRLAGSLYGGELLASALPWFAAGLRGAVGGVAVGGGPASRRPVGHGDPPHASPLGGADPVAGCTAPAGARPRRRGGLLGRCGRTGRGLAGARGGDRPRDPDSPDRGLAATGPGRP